jgi:hypothetical protein
MEPSVNRRGALPLVVHLDSDAGGHGLFCSSIAKQACDEDHRRGMLKFATL